MVNDLDLVFIADGELSFLMNSLRDMLEKKYVSTGKCNVSISDISELKPFPKLLIADAATLLDNSDVRVYLYDRCIEQNKKLILIGDDDALKNLLNITGSNVIAQSYKRPINNNEIAENIRHLIDEIDEKGTRESVLVIDDSPTFLRLVSGWLENDYNVNVCPSATAAFHMIETNKPDLILLDYEMPICNGGQFLQMLHSEAATADIPVIFLTSKDDANTVKSLIELKPQGYLLKNQTKEAILQQIANFFIKEKMK